MALFLAPHVHAVAIGDDLVFLDVAADAYFCLVGAARAMALEPEGGLSPADADSARVLVDAGLVAETPPGPRRRPPPKPTFDLRDAGRKADASDVVALAGACVATAAAFRFDSFATLITKTIAQRRSGADVSSEAVLDAAAVFARLRPWSPVGGVCLKRSHLQLQYLRRRGLEADWVIGVRTWPFMAHCWLQAGSVALDDDVERLVAYTPIMVV